MHREESENMRALREILGAYASKHRILVAEDDELVGPLVVSMLESMVSCDIDLVASGDDAEAMAETHRYSLILLDLMLLDGDVRKHVPRLKELSPMAMIVYVSGHFPLDTLLDEADKDNVVVALKKPFSVEELRLILRYALGTSLPCPDCPKYRPGGYNA